MSQIWNKKLFVEYNNIYKSAKVKITLIMQSTQELFKTQLIIENK